MNSYRTHIDPFYQTANSQYGFYFTTNDQIYSKTDKIPTYAEIGASFHDFEKLKRLIKSKIVREKLQSQGFDPNILGKKIIKITKFPMESADSYHYPQHGLNIGSIFYRTTNMTYGQKKPNDFQLPTKYYPCNYTFTKSFLGRNKKFEGLNTVKSTKNIHEALNEF